VGLHSLPMNTHLLSAAIAALITSSLSAQVAHWRLVKGPFHLQTANNTQPSVPLDWSVGVYLGTTNPGDATSVTISGGGIVGSLALQNEGGGQWSLETDTATQAALNVVFPSSSSYTLTVSGGTLGTLVQQFALGAESYPNIPFLTGTMFTTVQQYAAAAPFTLTWNSPGPLTQNSGVSILSIFDRLDDEVYRDLTINGAVSSMVPANTLVANECYLGFIEFTHAFPAPGAAFGVTGTTSHNTSVDFTIGTHPFPVTHCALTETFGAGCESLDLDANPPVLGTTWVLTTSGVTPNALGFTFFGFGEQVPPIPLTALGLNAPGCVVHIPLNAILVSLASVAVGGQLTASISVPGSSAFAGMELTVQSAALGAANPAGIASSNGLLGQFGN